MFHPLGSLWGVSLISASFLFRCCAYPDFLSMVEVLLKSVLSSNTAELSGSLRHKFLLCCSYLVWIVPDLSFTYLSMWMLLLGRMWSVLMFCWQAACWSCSW